MRFFLIFSLVFLSACSSTWRKKMTMPRVDYLGNELNIQGVYHTKSFGYFLLYRNGVYMGGASAITGVNDINGLVEYLSNKKIMDFHGQYPSEWGVFQIADSSITIQKWFGRNAGEPDPLALIKGKILNDTTLILNDHYFPPQHSFDSDTFRFFPLVFKPDSTNNFIK